MPGSSPGKTVGGSIVLRERFGLVLWGDDDYGGVVVVVVVR
jgi:hypothetical protein